MTEYIGDIPVSSVQNVEITKSKEQDEIYLVGEDSNIIVDGIEQAKQIQINFTLLKQSHPDNLSVEKQRDEVSSLTSSSLENNKFKYNGYIYYLSIENVSIPDDSEVSNLYRGTISATAFPWPKIESFIKVEKGIDGYGSGVYGNGPYPGTSTSEDGYGLGDYNNGVYGK